MSPATRIAVAFQSWQQYAEAPIVGAARFAQQHGPFDLVDVQFKDDLDVPKAINRIRPDGVITQLNERLYNVIGNDFFRMLPLVNVGADLFARGVATVATDLPELVRMAAAHLTESGYTNLAVMASTPSSSSDELPRLFARASSRPESQLFIHRITWPGEDVAHDPGPNLELQRWLERLPKPIGIFVQYGFHGLWITQECQRLQLQVPDEVGIISGLDENVCLFAKPAITSVRLSGLQLGFEAMRLLSELIRNPAAPRRFVTVKPQGLVQRASTGPVTHEGEDILRALRFIQEHATQGIRVPDVLRHTQTMSRSRFFSLFQHRVGRTPAAEIRRAKIERAIWHLSDTELSITQIANLCGFNSIKQFCETFHDEIGMTAGQFRKENRKSLPSRTSENAATKK